MTKETIVAIGSSVPAINIWLLSHTLLESRVPWLNDSPQLGSNKLKAGTNDESS